jgi:hypothetical protein
MLHMRRASMAAKPRSHAMPLDAPFELGPFRVDEGGTLALARPDSLPRFHLAWRGVRVEARIEAGGDGAMLQLEAIPGRVPSTAAGNVAVRDAAVREAVFSTLRGLPRALPRGWQMALQADHRVALRAARPLALPTTACTLLVEVTMFLLALAPYLDLLAEAGVESEAAAGAPGTAKTWPG